MRRIGWFRVVVAVAIASVTASFSPVYGYSQSGSAYVLNVSGYFNWCEPDVCFYWSSSSNGFTEWYTYLSHSEGTSEYVVRPFQQDELLHDGREVQLDGLYPVASAFSDIYNRSGTRIISSFRPSGSSCYASAYGSNDLHWGRCSTTGFIIVTSSYPPGTAKSRYYITDSAAVGGFFGNYSGYLR